MVHASFQPSKVGRVPSLEIQVADSLVGNLLLEGEFEKIPSLLDVTGDGGSHSFNQDLLRLVKAGIVASSDALKATPNPKALEMNLKGIFLNEERRIIG